MAKFIKHLFIFCIVSVLIVPPQAVYALPTGASVQEGTATVTSPTANRLLVEQSTDRAVIEYTGFSIDTGEIVQFIQPNSASIALNRVTGVDPSKIMGTLTATGRVFLINPNGVIFGSGAFVDVAGLLASSLDVDDAEFMNSDAFHFSGAGTSVVNNGNIRLHTPGGFVVLLGASVKNAGDITAAVRAQTGKIVLASGEKITVALDSSSIINVAVDEAATVNPDSENAAVINEGSLKVANGEILLTTETLDTVFDQAINTSGLIEATEIRGGDGSIALVANNDIHVGGQVLGGDVKVVSTDGNVIHEEDSVVETTHVDGDFQGFAGKNYTIGKNATVDVNGDADIYAGQDLAMDSGVKLAAKGDMFLTAENGSIEKKSGGSLKADGLVLNMLNGIKNTLLTAVNTLSALNRGSGDIEVSNTGIMRIADTSTSLTGMNSGVGGLNGVVNQADGGEIYVSSSKPLTVDAPVTSLRGDITLKSGSHIIQTALGDITVLGNEIFFGLPAPINLTSPSHTLGEVSEDRTVDVVWQVGDPVVEGTPGNIGLVAYDSYTMEKGATVESHGGDVTLIGVNDVRLTKVDAGLGTASITSEKGDIIDNDLGVAPGDYDVIAHIVKLMAPNGSVGDVGPEEEIDLGLPYDFSYLWNNVSSDNPDLVPETYTASLGTDGRWQMATTSPTLADGDWWFHVSTVRPATSESAGPASVGPFLFRSSNPPDERLYGEEYSDEFPVYYEILSPSQFLSFEPATAIGLYAYHPLTEVDEKAFDDIRLDVGAYEFIEDKIEKKKKFAPYFGG